MKIANDNYQIQSDGVTVWVNHSSGYCMGRFGRMGIDIHNDPDEQERTGVQCLYCTHAETTRGDWADFVEQMEKLYSVPYAVLEPHRPRRCG